MGGQAPDKMTILRRDGSVLTRGPVADDPVVVSDAARLLMAATSGTTRLHSPVDGAERILAWRTLEPSGLIIRVGLDVERRLGAIASQLDLVRTARVRVLALVVIVSFTAILAVRWRRRVLGSEARAEAARDRETLFRRMAEGLPDLIRVLDRFGIVIYANPSARAVLGVAPESLIGQTTGLFVHPDDKSDVALKDVLHQPIGHHARSEVRVIRPDGQIAWIQTDLRVIGDCDDTTAPQHIVTASRDVTRAREAELELRRAKEQLDTLLVLTLGALFRTRIYNDGELRIIFISDSIERIMGYTPAEVMDPKMLRALLDPAFLEETALHRRRLETEGASTVRYRARHRDGRWRWLEVSSQRTDDFGPNTYAGYVRDITRDRDRDVQLAQVGKLAMLGEMVTGMAHELNQPVAGISMLAENALAIIDAGVEAGMDDNASLRGKLDHIVEQATRMGVLIDHMRVFGRKQEGAPVEFSAVDAIEGALSILRSRLDRVGIVTDCRYAADLPSLTGYLVLLEQVVINVVGNAADAIEAQSPGLAPDRRGIEIEVSRTGPIVSIAIADHAGGVDEQVLLRMFEPFFTTKPVGRGTGLGLSISYGIIEDMGGRITAANHGDGTLVRIELTGIAPGLSA